MASAAAAVTHGSHGARGFYLRTHDLPGFVTPSWSRSRFVRRKGGERERLTVHEVFPTLSDNEGDTQPPDRLAEDDPAAGGSR